MPQSFTSMYGKTPKNEKFDELNKLGYTVPIKNLSLEQKTAHYYMEDSIVTNTKTVETEFFDSNSAKNCPSGTVLTQVTCQDKCNDKMKLHCSVLSAGYEIVPIYIYDDCSQDDGYYIKGMAGNGGKRNMRIVCVLVLVSNLFHHICPSHNQMCGENILQLLTLCTTPNIFLFSISYRISGSTIEKKERK